MASPNPQANRQRQRPPPRKKACQSCTRSKVRCSLERPTCSRCRSLGRVCEYSTTLDLSHTNPPAEGSENTDLTTLVGPQPPTAYAMPIAVPTYLDSGSAPVSPTRERRHRPVGSTRDEQSGLDFTKADLIPASAAESIRDRWLRPYILPPLGRDEIPKVYHPFTLQYISRILATYPRFMLKDGKAPPLIHQSQVSGGSLPQALANCYSLVRMWENAVLGSEAMVINTIETEMERLSREPPSQHDHDLLSSFQAYLIYSIMLYFSPRPAAPAAVTDKVMITLMELASRTARNGFFCASEMSHSRPSWESWIVVASKRRAIFVMYLFCSVYNSDRLLPNFIADEVRGVFAPEGRSLWEAPDRETWEREYDRHLLIWEDGMLEISELWRSADTGTVEQRERIERWLQTVDEFGMLLFGVTAHIHGC
ncbi:Zn(II)2Cys6 transcription factor domain-containing protein [Aspergillus homomorphus CBS 101889]|uniref:C6 finger domain protein n=1 Tax=Aspergillus homomorphus (strain CBS 101889) TaxID=1450537 RepID=A0A395HY79_ASPHC|nr:C6 finger domain protein [Aspergillus homomorphus CBS 101889]RAL12892.1 C6 finger domain protein [Aspergillus homomorphus CBS 101889]